MNVFGTILIGLCVGLVARFVKPGDDRMGLILTALLGIAGAFVGRFIGQAMGVYRADEPAGFIGAVLGAVLLLVVLKSVTTHRKISH
jgi:uncharacterized membrane protein YeaQ/YmgE (transglycosylase-associated protein family)